MKLNKILFLISFIFLLSACDSKKSTDTGKKNDSTSTQKNTVLQWPPVTGATKYELGLEKQDGTAWKTNTQTASQYHCGSGKCSYSPSGFTTGAKIKWWVRAFVSGKWGEWSKEKHITIVNEASSGSGGGGDANPADKQAPTAPTNLSIDKVKSDSAAFKWKASTDNIGVTEYNIFRDSKYLDTVKDTKYEDKSVKANTTYRYTVTATDAQNNESLASKPLTLKTTEGGHTGIKEPAGIYDTDNDVLEMYVHIYAGSGACSEDKYDGCTFGQVLNDLDWEDDFKPEVKVDFSTNNFSADATFRQRGEYTRFNPMKSFRVKLEKDSKGKKVYWNGERRIQLLKSFDDLTRVRHKLSYDLFAEVDNLPSMRSRFVRLKVEDKGSFNFTRNPSYSAQSSYKETDMGLYLQVEYFGKEYLARRNWKKGSGIYKASDFSFKWDSETRDALSVDNKGKPYDKKAFEKKLEIKSGKDHRELINMMEAIHDTSNDFNTDVLNKYLDRTNYITWLAVNILTANNDTVAHNYYLYNPKGTKKFYFVPWDYDYAYNGPDIAYSAGGRISMPEKPPYWYTHAGRWGNDLHSRFLEDSDNLDALKRRVTELKRGIFSDGNVRAKLNNYESAISHLVTSDLDDQWSIYWQASESQRLAAYGKELDALAKNITSNYNKFLKYFDSPMPFYMDTAKVRSGEFSMTWNDSVSLQGDDVTYDLLISTSKNFGSGDIIEEITGITDNKYRMSWSHSSGHYFVKVIARDSQGNWQSAHNDYGVKDSSGNLLYLLYGVNTFDAN